jgi:ABC-type phosphate transport system permease subunit
LGNWIITQFPISLLYYSISNIQCRGKALYTRRVRYQRVGLSLIGVIALIVVVIAMAAVWLFLTNPVTVATAVSDGEISPFVRDLADVLLEALQGLLKYL